MRGPGLLPVALAGAVAASGACWRQPKPRPHVVTSASAPPPRPRPPPAMPSANRNLRGEVDPIGPLVDDEAGRLKVIERVLPGARATLVDDEAAPARYLVAITGPPGFEEAGDRIATTIDTAEAAIGFVALSRKRCGVIVARGSATGKIQIHVLTAPPLPPQVIAQSPVGEGRVVLEGDAGCLQAPRVGPEQVQLAIDAPAGTVIGQVFFR